MAKKTAPYIAAFDSPADEVVADILSENTRRQEELRLTPAERKRLLEDRRRQEERRAKERARSQSQAANRTVLLLPVDLKDSIEKIAAEHGCPISQVVTFFLYEALRSYEAGAFQIHSYKSPSYSPRYTAELIHPLDAERRQRRIEKKQEKGWG